MLYIDRDQVLYQEELTLAASDFCTEGNHISTLDGVFDVRTNPFGSDESTMCRPKIF